MSDNKQEEEQQEEQDEILTKKAGAPHSDPLIQAIASAGQALKRKKQKQPTFITLYKTVVHLDGALPDAESLANNPVLEQMTTNYGLPLAPTPANNSANDDDEEEEQPYSPDEEDLLADANLNQIPPPSSLGENLTGDLEEALDLSLTADTPTPLETLTYGQRETLGIKPITDAVNDVVNVADSLNTQGEAPGSSPSLGM